MTGKHPDLNRKPLTISMVMDSLREQCAMVEEARALVSERIAVRDRMIADAMVEGISYKRLAAVTGLSQHRLWRISVDAQEDTL
jgi:hypothetical protein